MKSTEVVEVVVQGVMGAFAVAIKAASAHSSKLTSTSVESCTVIQIIRS